MKNTSKRIYEKKSIRFGLIGEYQSGKSLLINCILQRPIATVGSGNATTRTVVNYRYSPDEHTEYHDNDGRLHILPIDQIGKIDTATDISTVDIYLSNEILKDFVLTDLPGFGANEEDNCTTRRILSDIDFAILIASNDKAIGAKSSTFRYIYNLSLYNIPYYFVLNCRDKDKWNCNNEANVRIAERDLELLSLFKPIQYPLQTDCMNIVNLMWYWYSICKKDDELIKRPEIKNALIEYGISKPLKDEVGEASNFEPIKRLFDMENRGFLELMSEIKRLKNEVCPIGTIQAFAFNRIPEGWMVCDGRGLNPDEYPMLFDAIGFTFGRSDFGSFRIPDLRGCFIRGWDDEGNVDKNREFGSFQDDAIHNHSHQVVSCSENGRHFHYIGYKHYPAYEATVCYHTYQHEHVSDYDDANRIGNRNTDHDGNHKHDITLGSATKYGETDCHVSDETRPKNVALLFCIKASNQVGSPYVSATNIPVESMKNAGNGVYERFIRLHKPFMITSDHIPLRYPIIVKSHDYKRQEIAIQRVGLYEPIKIVEEGVYFLRLIMSENTDKEIDEDLLEIFKIDSIGIIGDFNQWESSIKLNLRPNSLIYEGEIDLPNGVYEFKYRANDNWAVELGGDEANLSSWLGKNLTIYADGGRISIKLNVGNHPWQSSISHITTLTETNDIGLSE